MTAEQQQKGRRKPLREELAELPVEKLAELLVDAKMDQRAAAAVEADIKAVIQDKLGRGQVVHVASPPVELPDGTVVTPVGSVEVRHKSSSRLKYNEEQVIRLLEAEKLGPAYVTEETRVVKQLDRRAFEADVFDARKPGLKPLREHVTEVESDYIEVRGLPK